MIHATIHPKKTRRADMFRQIVSPSFRSMSQVLGETMVPRLNPGLGLLSPRTRRCR